MKHSEYIVIFLSGDEDTFYSFSLLGAFCAATYYMSNKGRDHRIKSIEDEFGGIYTDFNLTYKTDKA